MRNGRAFPFSKAENKEIKSIQFGLFSPQEIQNLSVCEINSALSYDNNGNPIAGGIYDLIMGTIEDHRLCSTCHCNKINCPGHFGHINLVRPVFHVGFIKEINKILRCICYRCHKILIYGTPKYEEIKSIKDPESRHSKFYNECKTIKICKAINEANESCDYVQPKYVVDGLKIKINFNDSGENKDYTPLEILEFFDEISDEMFEMLGYNLKYAHPKWMILQNLIVCPPSVRPSVSDEMGLQSQDDLSLQYKQIIIANKELSKLPKNNPTTIQDKYYNLQFAVATLMNNKLSCGNATKKIGQIAQPIKALFSRLKGKEGRIRGNLMGKRVDFSARTVISPDPNLEVEELGVPLSIAMNMTFPEVVTKYNKEYLQELIKNGPNKYPGAKYIIRSNGSIINLGFCNNINKYIEEGYIVERHLLNGDYVVFNRQPSLHKMSMMGHRVHVLNNKTFRLNLSVTTPYNADFDGDEMNMHVPQSIESIAEIKYIMSVEKQIISPQSNKPVMGIVQDSLIGCKLFTSRDTFLDFDQMMSLLIWIKGFNIENLPIPCILKPKPLWSGKQIFSLILPKELNLTTLREDSPKGCEEKLNLVDNFVQIRKGELIQGMICKKTVGTSTGGIIHKIWIEISPQKTTEFLSNCQKLINNYLLLSGWTIGIDDMICDKKTNDEISEILKNMEKQIDEYWNDVKKDKIDAFEKKANNELNNARDNAGKVVQKYLSSKNHLKNMVSAGSKGNPTNISQIMAFVGQQNVEGKRIPFGFLDRTLPHFKKNDYKSKSKGFVKNSFIKGLEPHEFFFHAMGGREGIIDTSVKTSQTGYISRKLEKCLEDIMIKYDGTVRNSSGKIIQFLYGEDGFSGEYIESQVFQTLDMDNQTLEKNYKFFEGDKNNIKKLYKSLDHMKKYIEEAVINELKNNLAPNVKALNEEFNQIKNDRDYVRENILNPPDNIINIPVNINSIITLAKNVYGINDYSKSNLNPLQVLKEVQELKDELIKLKKINNETSSEIYENSLTLFNMVINYTLSTKNIIIKHRLNKDAFKYVIETIKHRFKQTIACPGEMVGSIASQSIGEPATQMTLNTFHLAGVSSVNVTLGVPRLIEIINNSKNIKTPSMKIYLKEKKDPYSKKEIFEILKKLEYIPLISIISRLEIRKDPDIFNSVLTEDKELIESYLSLNSEEYKDENLSEWVLRIVLNEGYLSIKLRELEEKIIKHFDKENILIMHSRENEKIRKFLIRLKCSKKKKPETQKEIKSEDYLKKFTEKLLTEIDCSGIKNINKVYFRECPKIKYDEVNGRLIPIKDSPKEIIFETDGSNLQKIFEIDEIDHKRTISNDINDIYNVMGIEAARKAIINELREVLKCYGIYINYRHISILVDFMTYRGKLTSITRFGLDKSEKSSIRKATFEESVKKFLNAGLFSEKDNLKGLSENILLGKLAKFGTNSFDLLYEFSDFNDKKKKLDNSSYNGESDNDDDNKDNSDSHKNNKEGNLSQNQYNEPTQNYFSYQNQPNNNQNVYMGKNNEYSPTPVPYSPTNDNYISSKNRSNANPIRGYEFPNSFVSPRIPTTISTNNNILDDFNDFFAMIMM